MYLTCRTPTWLRIPTVPILPIRLMGPARSSRSPARVRRRTIDVAATKLPPLPTPATRTLPPLPPLPPPATRTLRLQKAIGLLCVGFIISGLFIGTELTLSTYRPASAGLAHKIHIMGIVQVVGAFACLFALLTDVLSTPLRRSTAACLPLPEAVRLVLHKGEPLQGMANVHDEQSGRTFCTRCLLWRDATSVTHAHHCSLCQRCFEDHDHHCFFLGVCVAGTIYPPKGNMPVFTLQLLFAFTGVLTLFVTVALHDAWGSCRSHGDPAEPPDEMCSKLFWGILIGLGISIGTTLAVVALVALVWVACVCARPTLQSMKRWMDAMRTPKCEPKGE